MTDGPRAPRPLHTMTVSRVEWLNPTIVRVWFDAPSFAPNGFTDSYVKLLFDERGPILDDIPDRPTTRTYTVRHAEPGRLALDFVVHGDAGLAAPWAARCAVGDRVIARGPGGKWRPAEDASFHLFLGDESSLPAIDEALAALDADARGLVVVEVEEHTLPIAAPEGVDVRWIVRDGEPYREERLAEAAAELDWAAMGDVSVFAHGERGAMKALRAVFKEQGIERELLSISGYWALGRIEDEFQAEKKTPVGQI